MDFYLLLIGSFREEGALSGQDVKEAMENNRHQKIIMGTTFRSVMSRILPGEYDRYASTNKDG